MTLLYLLYRQCTVCSYSLTTPLKSIGNRPLSTANNRVHQRTPTMSSDPEKNSNTMKRVLSGVQPTGMSQQLCFAAAVR